MTSSIDVAKKAGLSQATVSRVFRNDPSVSEGSRRRVLNAASALGYLPNSAARMLVNGKTGIIGIVVADLANPYYPRVIDAMHAELASRGYRMALIRDRRWENKPDDSAVLAEASVDGAIFLSAARGDTKVTDFVSTGRPAVQMSRYDPKAATDIVVVDEKSAAVLIVDHLKSLGHRRIALLAGPGDADSSIDRADAFKAAMKEAGVDLPESMIRHAPITHEHGRQAAVELLERTRRPTAIYGASDVLAIAAMDVALGLGLTVPTDLSLVGFDDTEPAAWHMINLTTIHQPLEDMARKAVQILLDRVAGTASHRPEHIIFPMHLKVRASTGPVPRTGTERS